MLTKDFALLLKKIKADLVGKKKHFVLPSKHYCFQNRTVHSDITIIIGSESCTVDTYELLGYDPKKNCYKDSRHLGHGYYFLTALQRSKLIDLLDSPVN